MRTFKKIFKKKRIFRDFANSCKAAWIITLSRPHTVDHRILQSDELITDYLIERKKPIPIFLFMTFFFLSGIFVLPEMANYLVEASYGEDALFISVLVDNKVVKYLLVIIPSVLAVLGVVLQILHWRNFKLFRKYFEIETIGREYAGHS